MQFNCAISSSFCIDGALTSKEDLGKVGLLRAELRMYIVPKFTIYRYLIETATYSLIINFNAGKLYLSKNLTSDETQLM